MLQSLSQETRILFLQTPPPAWLYPPEAEISNYCRYFLQDFSFEVKWIHGHPLIFLCAWFPNVFPIPNSADISRPLYKMASCIHVLWYSLLCVWSHFWVISIYPIEYTRHANGCYSVLSREYWQEGKIRLYMFDTGALFSLHLRC